MEKVKTLIEEKNNIEGYCIDKYDEICISESTTFDSLLSWEIDIHTKKLLNISKIMEFLKKNNEIVDSECMYICTDDEVPHDAVYKGYVTVCEKYPGVVSYFRVIFKDRSSNKFYICDSYDFVPMR